MGQTFMFSLFAVVVIVGAFAYFAPKQDTGNPVGFIMDRGGLNVVENQFQKRVQELNVSTSNGVMKVRRQMDDLVQQQNKFLDTLEDQQVVLRSTNNQLSNILRGAQQNGQSGNGNVEL